MIEIIALLLIGILDFDVTSAKVDIFSPKITLVFHLQDLIDDIKKQYYITRISWCALKTMIIILMFGTI